MQSCSLRGADRADSIDGVLMLEGADELHPKMIEGRIESEHTVNPWTLVMMLTEIYVQP